MSNWVTVGIIVFCVLYVFQGFLVVFCSLVYDFVMNFFSEDSKDNVNENDNENDTDSITSSLHTIVEVE